MAGSDTLIGQIKLRYRIVATLEGEGMGVVYKAQHTALNRFVALKVLPEDLAKDAHGFARVRREAKAASASNHPNICAIYQTGDHDGRCFIARESMEGKTKTMSFSRHPKGLEKMLTVAIDFALPNEGDKDQDHDSSNSSQ